MTPEELHTLRVECYLDPTLFARVFNPHWFSQPMSWVHRGMLALLLRRADFLMNFGEEQWPKSSWEWDETQLEKILRYFVWKENPDDLDEVAKPLFVREEGKIHLVASQKTALMLPRGVGKTTVINLANEISILYKDISFLVYVSETAGHAETQLRNIKREFETNEKIREVFGDLQPERASGKKWTDQYIETTTGVAVAARGRGGQIRGLLVNGNRPDRIVVDDVEDKESVSTEEQLRKTKVWFHGDLVPALPQMSGQGEIIVSGTLLNPNALLKSLTQDPEWVSAVFGALDSEGEPIAPFYMSKEEYERKRLSFARSNMLLEFEMEYNSTIYQDDETRKFKVEGIKVQVMSRTEFLAVAEVIDPAISEERKADYTTIAVTGMTEKGQHHVLDCFAKVGMNPREQIDKFFDLHFLWLPTHHGVETIAYQAALVHLLQEEMFRRAKTHGAKAYFEITKIVHGRTRKEHRVEGILSPRYAAGYISHQRHFPELITQLRDWPLGKKDCPDAVSMAIALLDPFAATAAFDGALDDEGRPIENPLVRDQFRPLEEEIGNWRTAP